MKLFIATFAVCLLPTWAYPLSGSELYDICSANTSATSPDICAAYLRGYVDGSSSEQARSDAGLPQFCFPIGSVSPTQARLIVRKYFQDHPWSLNKDAAFLVSMALVDAFPCPSTRKSN